MLFDNLSPKTDFSSKIQSNLDIINGNILYLTHEIDHIKKLLISIENSTKLQKQVDDYFDRDETSPQTDPDNKNDLD